MRRPLGLALGICATAAAGATLGEHSFEFADGHTRYHFEAELAAPAAAVRRAITEPGLILHTNPGITESRDLAHAADGSWVREIRMRQCVIGFCFDVDFVERVAPAPDGELRVTQLPGTGSFRTGHASWRTEALGPRTTTLRMAADQVPSFWIPPLIGPLLMRRTFERQVRETITNIEQVANAIGLR